MTLPVSQSTGKIHLGIQIRDVKTRPRIAFKTVKKVTLFGRTHVGRRRPRNATALES
ncbi:hypothetical protein MPLA_1320013 [Mesorhizobium sp. ORS 3359]|nr:hypothetical protein MPLA_1320013 [Mesorhizobium sp. ORS 3359]